MHIFISGASGRNGRIVLQEALDKGHTVTVLVRNPDSLTPHPNLTILKGKKERNTPLPSSIFYILSPVSWNPLLPIRRRKGTLITHPPLRHPHDPQPPPHERKPLCAPGPGLSPDLLESTTKTLLSAIRGTPFAEPPKIVVNSLFGAGSSWPNMSFPLRFVMHHSTMKLTIKDHNKVDALVRESGLPFVLARPARLTEGAVTKVKVWPDDGAGCGWNPSISRDSLGKWMVHAAESNEWDGKSPVLAE
ncbi:hypothetical protein PT974_02649 [Cladobotryum mycophilum]|uniref:NAD(P)-binding domain-containing protein n=1 Tax=Cladobotryum mycophilum TaxID=491253 RepID=A0ABR0SZ74_9HYPO